MDSPETTSTAEAPRRQPFERPDLRVLIVEDDATTVLLLRRSLRDAGYEVVGQASNGSDGIDMARETQPDLILMDCNMPGIDGIEATRRIMEDKPVPIIMLTGHSEEYHINKAFEAGACTYLVKPINRALLLPAVQTAFNVFAGNRL